MYNIHHKKIKSFGMEGTIGDDSAIGRLHAEYIRLIKEEMADLGYTQRLDIDPDFTIQYNEAQENFKFKLTVYGTYVGKSKSKWTIGIDGTQAIATQQSRLSESLQDRESQSNLR